MGAPIFCSILFQIEDPALVLKKGSIVLEYYCTDSAHRNYLKCLYVTQLVHIVLHLECHLREAASSSVPPNFWRSLQLVSRPFWSKFSIIFIGAMRQLHSGSTACAPRIPLALQRDLSSSLLMISPSPMASGHGLPTPTAPAAVYITDVGAVADPSLLHSPPTEGISPHSFLYHAITTFYLTPHPHVLCKTHNKGGALQYTSATGRDRACLHAAVLVRHYPHRSTEV